MPNSFPQLTAAIQDGIQRKLHTGVQAYVSVAGEVVLDQGFGESANGIELDASTIMLWRSAGKPVTAVAILQLLEQGLIDLAATLPTVLPETQDTAWQNVTIQQLLTHTSGIPLIDTGWPNQPWNKILQTIISAKVNGTEEAAYQPQSTWFLLGEILMRASEIDGSFSQLLKRQIFSPLGIEEVWCGLPSEEVAKQTDQLPILYERTRGQLQSSNYSTGAWLTEASPGGNLRGAIRGLGEFYEMLMRQGVGPNGVRVISEQSVKRMTDRHRINQFDTTLQHIVDFGLGLIINSNQYGASTVPYGFGRFSSENSFGHGGSQCSMGFCDPEHQLVVAWAANAFCGEGQHQRRNRAINEAIYEDLGLSTT